jgi:hypothetical protein
MELPMVCIIDDGAPCINIYWWHALEAQKTDKPIQRSGEPVLKRIPIDFLEEFVEVIRGWGIKGKFSLIPYPAGLGSISDKLKGYPKDEVDLWVKIVREELSQFFDITPEILTHAKTLDLSTMTLLEENEREWATHQTEETLTPYIAYALRILKDVGIDANGVTSPWDFGRVVEEEYRLSILNAQKQVYGRGQTWYFLHMNDRDTVFHSKAFHPTGREEEWVVSVVSQCGDLIWETMDRTETDEDYVRSIVDRYMRRFSELIEADVPVVFHTHWQSLFSNGRRTGLKVLEEIGKEVERRWERKVRWTKCSELARAVAE